MPQRYEHARPGSLVQAPYDEKDASAAGFLDRVVAFYARLGVTVERVIIDNAFPDRRATAFRDTLARATSRTSSSAPTAPGRLGKSNGQTAPLAAEWAYVRRFTSNDDRAAAVSAWLDYYKLDRHHLGIGGVPLDRINNGRGQYS